MNLDKDFTFVGDKLSFPFTKMPPITTRSCHFSFSSMSSVLQALSLISVLPPRWPKRGLEAEAVARLESYTEKSAEVPEWGGIFGIKCKMRNLRIVAEEVKLKC